MTCDLNDGVNSKDRHVFVCLTTLFVLPKFNRLHEVEFSPAVEATLDSTLR